MQLEARNKALEDAQSELELAYKQIQENEDEDRKQQKIDKLTAQVFLIMRKICDNMILPLFSG